MEWAPNRKNKVEQKKYLKGDYLQDEGYNIGYPALPMDVAFAKAKIGSVSFVSEDSERNAVWETKLYYNFINHAMDDTQRPASMVPIHMDMPGTSRTFGAYSSFSGMLGTKHHLQGRIDGYNNRLTATMTMYPEGASQMFMFTLPDLSRTSAGVSLNDHINWGNFVNIRLGGRLEWNYDYLFTQEGKEQLSGIYPGDLSRNRIIGNLSIGADYQITGKQKVSLDISRGARSATLQEAYGFYIFNRADGFDYLGNPDLKQETSTNLNLSYQYRSRKFTAVINPFLYLFNDYIVGTLLEGYSVMTIGAYGVKQYVNIVSAQLYGASLNINWTPLSNLKLSSNTTLTQGKDGDGHWLPLIAPLRTINSVSYQVNGFSGVVEAVVNGAQEKTSPEFYGEYSTPGSAIINLNFSKSLKWNDRIQCRIFAGVENVFDKSYYQHLDVMKVRRPGRNFVVRTTFSF